MGKGVNVVAVAAAGFIAGMLLAPKSGKETRQDLMDKAHDAKKVAREKAEHMKHAMKDGVDTFHAGADEVKDLSLEAKQRAKRVAEKAKNASTSNDIEVDVNRRAM